jgi:uncharacterized protein (DUF305 family)
MPVPRPVLIAALGVSLAWMPARALADDKAHAAPPAIEAASSADQDMMAAMTRMNDTIADASMTGDADADFVAMMIPHHQGAIEMARAELKYGKDPVLRRLATEIVAAQDKEIAWMQRWQAAHPGQ